MNEETELWAAYKAHQKRERAERRASAEQHLKDRGINYTVHNDGAHIVIEEGGAIFDYWPGNTRWRMRPQKSQFGVHKLLAAITQRRVLQADLEAFSRGEQPLVSRDFSKLERHVLAYTEGPEAFVERMTRAYPHLKGE